MLRHQETSNQHQGVLCLVGSPTEVTQSLRRLGVWLDASSGEPTSPHEEQGEPQAFQQCGFDFLPFQPEGHGTGGGSQAPCDQARSKPQPIQLPFPLLESVHSQRGKSSGRGNAAPIGLCHCPPQSQGKGNSGNDCRKRAGPDAGQDGRGEEKGCQCQCQARRTCSSQAPQSFQIFDEEEEQYGHAQQEVTKPLQVCEKGFKSWEEWQEPHPAWQAQQKVTESLQWQAPWEERQQPHPSGQGQKPFQGHGKGFAQQQWEARQQPHPSWLSEVQGYGKGSTQAAWEARQQPHPSCQHPPWEERQKPHLPCGKCQAHQGKEPFPEPEGHEDLAGWWGQQSESCQGLQASRWRPVLEAPQPDRHQRKITEFFPSKPSPPSAPADSSQASGDESRGSGDPEVVTQQEQVPCSGAPPPGEPLDHRLDRCEPRRARSLDGSQVEPRLESGPLVPRPASYPPAWNRPGLGQMGTAGRQLEGGPQSVPQLAEQTVAHTATPSTAQGECLCDKQEPKACSAESEWWSARSEGSLGERQPQGPEPQLQRKGQEQGLTARSLSPEQEQAEDQTEEACSPECTRQEGECSEEERRSEGRAGGISPLPGSLSQGQWVHATQPVSEVSGEEPWPLLGGDVGRRLLGGRPRLGKSNGRHRRSRLQRDAGQVPPAIDRGRNGSPGDDPGSQGTVGGGGIEAPADICGVEAKTRCCNGTDAHTGNCWSNARGSPVAVARPHTETPATNPAGQSSGRPPDITARVQQLRELRNRLAGQGSDGSVVGTIDVMLGMLDDSNEQPC